MRISVLVGDGPESLAMTRYTAKTSDVGFLTFVEYDELERAKAGAQWRKKRMWSKTDEGKRAPRVDGVEVIPRPALPADVRRRLLAAARAQIEWAKEE